METDTSNASLEARVSRLEVLSTTLTSTVTEFVEAQKSANKDNQNWQNRVERQLATVARPGWGIFAFIVPTVVVAATWVATYVGNISRHLETADAQIEERMATEFGWAGEQRTQMGELQKEMRAAQIKQNASLATIEERLEGLRERFNRTEKKGVTPAAKRP